MAVETFEQYLRLIWSENAFLIREEPFTLKSGLKSHVYANNRALICAPERLRFLAHALVATAIEVFGDDIAFCAVDSSTSPYFVAACSLESGFPLLNYRPINREKGLADVIFSVSDPDTADTRRSIVLIDDVVTTSATLDNAAMDLEFAGWRVAGAACLLDRRAAVSEDGIDIRGVANLRQALQFGLDNDMLDSELRRYAERDLRSL